VHRYSTSHFFLGPAQRRLIQRGIPVFTYHSIGDAPPGAKDPFLYVATARFDEQLAMLAQHGIESGSLDHLAQSETSELGKRAVITFDDGYRNVLRNGLEILVRHRFRAVQYIVAGMIGGRNEWDAKTAAEGLMDEGEIREWLAAGQEVGSHSLTHRNLSLLDEREARVQIMDSKKKLEDTFGVTVRHFAYPGGKWNEMARDLVGEAGYQTACTTVFGVNTAQTPRFEIKRIFPLSRQDFFAKVRHRVARKLGVA